MEKKIILSADGTCDIGEVLRARYEVHLFNFHILIGNQSFTDGVDVTPDDIFKAWRERGILPKTSAVSPEDYRSFFSQWNADEYDIVHLSMCSVMSASCNNCRLAAEQFANVYQIETDNVSSGLGLLVVKAGEMIKAGKSAPEIKRDITAMRNKSKASFVFDTLEFLRAGGRCSSIMMIGANLLRLKPEVVVDPEKGGVARLAKKYRGSLEKVLEEYVRDRLAGRTDIDTSIAFIPHASASESDLKLVKNEMKKYIPFRQVYVTNANCVTAAHGGPRTVGLVFMTK